MPAFGILKELLHSCFLAATGSPRASKLQHIGYPQVTSRIPSHPISEESFEAGVLPQYKNAP